MTGRSGRMNSSAVSTIAGRGFAAGPCVDGLSHNEAEEITKEWAMNGANVLLQAVVETAGVVG